MASQNIVAETQNATRREFQIRPARLEDMKHVAEFVSSSAEWYRPFVDEKDMTEHDVDEAWALENFKKRDFFIGEYRGNPIGTISLQYFGDHAYLGYIYLDVSYVGNGFGQRLMRFAERQCKKRGLATMNLIAHPEAEWAKRAYLKYGFDIIETEKKAILVWNDGVLKPYYEEGFELYQYDLDS